MIIVRRTVSGDVLEVEEQIGVAAPVLEQCAAVWERLSPTPVEQCALESADHATFVPLTLSDHRAVLEVAGYPAELHDPALQALEAVGMVRRHYARSLKDDIIYSPYVWGTEAVNVAAFMRGLPPNEREVLGGLARTAAERPGAPVPGLGSNQRLVDGARKVGLIDATRVLTTEGNERSFAFSPALEKQLAIGSTDVLHERKLFVAHILYGHLYGYPWTGKIETPIALVRALINKGTVGPTTSIRSDYPLLEARGIVKVKEIPGSSLGYLTLVKEDVAGDSLELLRLALGKDEDGDGMQGAASLWLPGSFTSPEWDRRRLSEPTGTAEAEVLGSAIEQLREETARRLRGEEV
jgi:hypothetical protein